MKVADRTRTPIVICVAMLIVAAAIPFGCSKKGRFSEDQIREEAARLRADIDGLPVDIDKANYFVPERYSETLQTWSKAADTEPEDEEELAQLVAAHDDYRAMFDLVSGIAWISTFGGDGYEEAARVHALADGTYLIAGDTTSFGSGQRDAFLVRVDHAGAEMDRFTFGGEENDGALDAAVLQEGDYLLSGRTGSFKDWTGDVYVVRADGNGGERWHTTFGTSGTDTGDVLVARDSGCLVIGNTFEGGGGKNIFVAQLDDAGTVVNRTVLPGDQDDWVNAGMALPDGRIVLAGGRGALNAADIEYLVIALDADGSVLWEQTYDDAGWSTIGLTGVAVSANESLYVTGSTQAEEDASEDVAVLRLSLTGERKWTQTLGGDATDQPGSVAAAADGGVVVAATTQSYGAGGSDILLAKYDADGNQVWARTLGSTEDESARDIAATPDDGFIVVGERGSFIEGIQEIYAVKTDANGYSWMGEPFGSKELIEVPHEETRGGGGGRMDMPEATLEAGGDAPPVHAAEWLNVPDTLADVLKPNEDIKLPTLGARLVVVEFWATWCGPCRMTIPHLNELKAKYEDQGVVFLSLTDEARDEAEIDRFMEANNMQTIIGTGSPSAGPYGAYVIPTAYLMNKDGKLVWQGHPMDGLDGAIEGALADE